VNKFCTKLNENVTETYVTLKQAYGELAVSRAQVYRGHKAFWMAMRVWKKNLVPEYLAHQKREKL
jgi:hypothetical protein